MNANREGGYTASRLSRAQILLVTASEGLILGQWPDSVTPLPKSGLATHVRSRVWVAAIVLPIFADRIQNEAIFAFQLVAQRLAVHAISRNCRQELWR